MSSAKKYIIFILVFCLFCSQIPFAAIGYAAPEPQDVDFRVKENDRIPVIKDEEVTVMWNTEIRNVKYFQIVNIDTDDILKTIDDLTITETNISGLSKGHIYNLGIKAYDSSNNPISLYNSDIKFMTKIVFKANTPILTVDDSKNNNEVGKDPELLIKITLPKEWDSTGYEYVYGGGYNYRIDLGNTKDSFDLGAIKLIWDNIEDEYSIYKDNIKLNDASFENGTVEFTIKEDWFKGIRPGNIYYAQISPEFSGFAEKYLNLKYVESPLTGPFGDYGFTFLHAVLTTGANNTIFIQVDRVNKGAINQAEMGHFTYSLYSGKTQGLIGTKEGEKQGDGGQPEEPISFLVAGKEFATTYYYQIIAKSAQSGVEIRSPIIVYNISRGIQLPPLPEEVNVLDVDAKADTADITIRWKKPDRYDSLKPNMAFQFELNSTEANDKDKQETIKLSNGDRIQKSLEYRKVFNLDLRNPIPEKYKFIDNKEYLQVTIPGDEIISEDNHPNYDPLKLNRIYFLRLKSIVSQDRNDDGDILDEGEVKVSDSSLPVSFTTGPVTYLPVPAPTNLTTYEEKGKKDEITVSWKRSYIDWEAIGYKTTPGDQKKVYYELYVSTDLKRAEDFADNDYGKFDESSIIKSGYGDEEYVWDIKTDNELEDIEFLLDEKDSNILKAKVSGLLPDTNYYFIVRTRLEVENIVDPIYSVFSNIHAENTSRGDVEFPEDDERKLQTPDPELFKVSEDKDGNPIITSYTAQVEWGGVDEADTYRLICTPKPVKPEDTLSKILEENTVIKEYIVNHENLIDIYIKIIEGLTVNTQYYISIRAEKGSFIPSDWITIPITTKLIQAPTDYQILYDSNIDNEHEIKIQWKALDMPDYKFDIAIRPEGRELNASDKLHSSMKIEGGYLIYSSDNPYISSYLDINREYANDAQKPSKFDKSFNIFRARIKGLDSNTRYHIKVRIKDIKTGAVSKYTQTLSTRTEFSQEDYDDDKDDEKNDITFVDRIDRFTERYIWVYEDTYKYYKVKVRGDKAINYINNDPSSYFNIDISGIPNEKAYRKTVYIPYKVIEELNNKNKSLVIKTENGDFHFRPNTLDQRIENIDYMKQKLKTDGDVKDIYIEIDFENLKSSNSYSPINMELKSGISYLEARVEGFNMTDNQVEANIRTWLYGADGNGGMVKVKRDELLAASSSDKENSEKLNKLIDELIEDLEEELGEYIREDYVENSRRIEYSRSIEKTSRPMLVSLIYESNKNDNHNNAYINTGKSKQWEKIESILLDNLCTFETTQLAKYAVLRSQQMIYDIYDNPYSEDIQAVNDKYNILGVFGSYGYFYPDQAIKIVEMVKVVEKVLEERTKEFERLDYIDKAQKLGLIDKLNIKMPNKNLSRQEAAYLIVRLYEIKSGASIEYLNIPSQVMLIDEKNIRIDLFRYAAFAHAYGFIDVKGNYFNPQGSITRAEAIAGIKRVMEMLGE